MIYKRYILCLLIILLSNVTLKSEWKTQTFNSVSDSLGIMWIGSWQFDETNSFIYCGQILANKNLANVSEHPYILKIDVNDLSIQTPIKFDFKNKQQIFKMSKNSLVYSNSEGLGIYNLTNYENKFFKIGDKFDNQIVYPKNGSKNTTIQYDREFRNLLIDNDSIFITSTAREIDEAQLIGSMTNIHIANSWTEIWKFHQSKFTLMYRDSVSKGASSTTPIDFIQNNQGGFYLSSSKNGLFQGMESLYKISSNYKWESLPEVDSVKVMAQASCISLISEGNKFYAKYATSIDRMVSGVQKKYDPVSNMFVVYENDLPISAIPLASLGRDANTPLIRYKDYIFLASATDLYIYKDNKFSKIDINNGKGIIGEGAKSYEYFTRLQINDKGIFIVNRDSTYEFKILYNRDIDAVIASTGIDNEIDTKEYFNVLNNKINFLKQADSYMISDIQGRVYTNKVNPNSIEPLPTLANGTYFILAHYGENYISSKILITK